MSYRVIFGPGGGAQFHNLPEPGRDALITRSVTLADAPWDDATVLPGGDPRFRETTFGAGRGLVSFHVDDAAEVIRIYNIVWTG